MSERLALVMGDPAGIGPELFARLLAEPRVRDAAAVIGIGDRRVLARGIEQAGVRPEVAIGNDPEALCRLAAPGRPVFWDLGNCDPAACPPGRVSAAAGASALSNFRAGLDLARTGRVQAITFTPFNKQAIRLVHPTYEDEAVEARAWFGLSSEVSEINVTSVFWNARVTSHVPLKDVAGLLSSARILERLCALDRALAAAGKTPRRIAVAALNPHAGEGGAFGREEIDIIAPAVERARALGIEAEGPYPADTVFLRAARGAFDAVLSMYHDQGQIAVKLLGFAEGVTLLWGTPVPITTPAHGTAFDIVGARRANPEPSLRAAELALRMARADGTRAGAPGTAG
ncbi:MAG: 4-hydroxythreonine-4-phosphate dehydrogenase PdxA [Geminicoccaceae bacterium]|nr:4-hydroxythreonine-4-phosphate dehydrogenase PdxA [Geminicoccaceae bacterium]MDW8341799.1 4-hydroxythreonine-4-phosphate dehydrogenase PdxA [Geminicoccaceae bacterium]